MTTLGLVFALGGLPRNSHRFMRTRSPPARGTRAPVYFHSARGGRVVSSPSQQRQYTAPAFQRRLPVTTLAFFVSKRYMVAFVGGCTTNWALSFFAFSQRASSISISVCSSR